MSEYIPPANQLVDLIKGRGNWHSLIDALARLDPTYIDLPSIDRALPIQHFRYGLTIAQSKLSQHDPKSASKILYQLAEIVPADTYEEFWFIEVCIELYLQCQRPAAALEFCNEALGKVALENFPDQKTRFLTLRAKITNSLHELLQAKDKDLN